MGQRKTVEQVSEGASHVSGRVPSHVSSRPVPVGERETTPAPPDAELTPGAEGALRLRTPFTPAAAAVPFRTGAVVPDDLDLRLAFVLLHVDGEATFETIAQMVALPNGELQARFLELLAMGLVDLRA